MYQIYGYVLSLKAFLSTGDDVYSDLITLSTKFRTHYNEIIYQFYINL